MGNGSIILLMTACFLVFGYMGVPVAFALMAGVLAACMLTPISMQSMVGQMFHGIDSEILLAVPFFLLVGELMTSADVTNRMIRLAQTMVGHLRGGLAQVVTLFSMFFAGISGSSTADVAVLSRTVAPEMTREGYERGEKLVHVVDRAHRPERLRRLAEVEPVCLGAKMIHESRGDLRDRG